MTLTYHFKFFSDLSLNELYQIMSLRQEVFIVEQDCPYLDADGKDQASGHILAMDDNDMLQAYTRLVPPGVSYSEYSSIGRVVNAKSIRGTGVGKELMHFSINKIQELHPYHDIKISAQVYLDRFYRSLGFEVTGEFYDEDGIPHQAMIKKTK